MPVISQSPPESQSKPTPRPAALRGRWIASPVDDATAPATLAGRRLAHRFGVAPASADTVANLAGFAEVAAVVAAGEIAR